MVKEEWERSTNMAVKTFAEIKKMANSLRGVESPLKQPAAPEVQSPAYKTKIISILKKRKKK